MMEFPRETIQDITSALAKHSVIALCGPPGCGKRAILKHMGYEDSLDLDKVVDYTSEYDGVKPLLKQCQNSLAGTKVWLIKPAELITRQALVQIKERGSNLILLSCEKVAGIHTVYMKAFSKNRRLEYLHGKGFNQKRYEEILTNSARDMRQMQMHIDFPDLQASDKLPHPYNDTLTILNGHKLPNERLNVAWIEQNSAGSKSIEDLAQFYDNLATADNKVIEKDVVALSVPLLGKRMQLEAPDYRVYKRRRLEQPFDYKNGPRAEDPKPVCCVPITVFSTATYEVKTCTPYCGGAGQAHVGIGEPVPNSGKQRTVLLAVSALSIEEAFALLQDCKAVHTFTDNGQTVSLVFKDKLTKIKGFDLFAVNGRKGRVTNADIVQVWEGCKNAEFKSNLREQILEIEGEMPDIEQAVNMYYDQGYTADCWPIVHGNALRARKEGNMTPFQTTIVTCGHDMENLVKAKPVASQVTFAVEDAKFHFINDFLKQRVFGLKGVHLVQQPDASWKIQEITLGEILWKELDKHKVFGLYNEKTLIFNGMASMGKSEFVKALGAELAKRKECTLFGSGAICPFGSVTLKGGMKDIGCFIFDDFELSTRGGSHRLTSEEMKHLLYVKDNGNVPAFYHTAIFPANKPRLWCINYKCAADSASWFEKYHHLGGLTGLVKREHSFFSDPNVDQTDIAIARRAVIFNVDKLLFQKMFEAPSDNAELAALEVNATPCPF